MIERVSVASSLEAQPLLAADDPPLCSPRTACPSLPVATLPRCTQPAPRALDVTDFFADERHWADDTAVRLRGILALSDPYHHDGRRVPLTARGDAPDCSAVVPWRLGLQSANATRCYNMPIDVDDAAGVLGCLGNLTQSCCQPLPLGRGPLVVARGVECAIGGR